MQLRLTVWIHVTKKKTSYNEHNKPEVSLEASTSCQSSYLAAPMTTDVNNSRGKAVRLIPLLQVSSKVSSKSNFRVVCDHNPNNFF